jgi:hypothetical protein
MQFDGELQVWWDLEAVVWQLGVLDEFDMFFVQHLYHFMAQYNLERLPNGWFHMTIRKESRRKEIWEMCGWEDVPNPIPLTVPAL